MMDLPNGGGDDIWVGLQLVGQEGWGGAFNNWLSFKGGEWCPL